MSELGVAVVGLGVGEQHARAFLATGRCRLRWLCDLDSDKAARLARTIGSGSTAGNLEQILTDDQTQVVSIASYDDAHSEQVVAALNAGKHVFVEKPLCRSTAELDGIRAALGDRHLGCNLVLRTAPLYRWLKQAIAAGELGEIYAFDGDYLYGRIEKITDGWRTEVGDYSVFQGGAVHLVDLMIELTGQRPESVSARGNRIATAGSEFRYDDFVAATFTFPSKMVGRITANFGCVHRHQHAVRIFGTKGTFIYDDQGARLHTSRDPSVPPKRLEEEPLPASKGELIPPFVRGILEGEDPGPRARQELNLIQTCLAADRALQLGKAVEVDPA